MKIYTRKGDDGSTGLFGGSRVGKSSARVEAYGVLDELNAVLGWTRAAPLPPAIDDVVARAQESCLRLGAWLASAAGADPGVVAPGPIEVAELESEIDDLEQSLPPLQNFVLPGGVESAARLHVARTVTRRAERAIVRLGEDEPLPDHSLAWTNRLSDYLFVASRAANHDGGGEDILWNPRR